jgi:hypothetical protein
VRRRGRSTAFRYPAEATLSVADMSDRTSSELAERLRRWIVVAGYLLGGWAILQAALNLVAWGLPFNRGFRIGFLTLIHRLATALWMVAPLLLVAGCWGFQQHRSWARPVLLTYAGMWIAGVFGAQVVQFIDTLSGAYGDVTFRQLFSMALSGLDLAVYASVFPVSLVLCLLRPDVRDQFPEFRMGFGPIVGGKSG